MASLLSWGKKAVKRASQVYDQVNPLDNGRTYQQRAPVNQRSILAQSTHNAVTNTVGNFTAKPFVLNPAATAIETGRGLAAEATHNQPALAASQHRAFQDVKESLPGQLVNSFALQPIQVARNLPRAVMADVHGFQGKAPNPGEQAALAGGAKAFHQTPAAGLVSPVEKLLGYNKSIASQEQATGFNPKQGFIKSAVVDPVQAALAVAGTQKGITEFDPSKEINLPKTPAEALGIVKKQATDVTNAGKATGTAVKLAADKTAQKVAAHNAAIKALPESAKQGGYIAGPGAKGFKTAEKAGDVTKFPLENKPTFEVSDEGAKAKPLLTTPKAGVTNTTLKDVLDHPKLYEQYPEFKDMPVKIRALPKGTGGQYSIKDGIELNKNASPEIRMNTVLHELQHAIQDKEGLQQGGDTTRIGAIARQRAAANPDAYVNIPSHQALATKIAGVQDKINEANGTPVSFDRQGNITGGVTKNTPPDLLTQYNGMVKTFSDNAKKGTAKFATYQDILGENVARTVANRKDLTDAERKAMPFYSNLDKSPTNAIVRGSSPAIGVPARFDPITRKAMAEVEQYKADNPNTGTAAPKPGQPAVQMPNTKTVESGESLNVKGSSFANRTAPNSPQVSEALGATLKNKNVQYTPQTEAAGIAKATEYANKGSLATNTLSTLNTLDKEKGTISRQDALNATQVALKLQEKGGKADLENSANILAKLSEHYTASGQLTQAAATLARQTPQGLYYTAIKTLKNAGVEQTDDLLGKIKGATDAIKGTKAGTDERAIATQKLIKMVNNVLPRSKTDALAGIWRAGLLTGPETVAKVAVSHGIIVPTELASQVPAAIVDRGLATYGKLANRFGLPNKLGLTGDRTVSATLRGLGEGAAQGAKGTLEKLKSGTDLPRTGSFEESFGSNKHQTPYERVVGDVHAALPKTGYSARYTNSLYDQALTEARNRGLTGTDRQSFVQDFVKTPEKGAMDIATHDAERAALQQKTSLGEAAAKMQSWKIGKVPVGKFLVPFTRIPSAIGTTGLVDYTPLGFGVAIKDALDSIKETGKFDQRTFSQATGRAATGTSIAALGAVLMSENRLTLKAPTDAKEKALWLAQGKQPNSIKIGDKWVSLNSLGPIGITMAAGGSFQKGMQDSGGDITKGAEQALAGGAGELADQPYVKGVAGLSKALTDPANEGANWFNETAGSVVPAAAQQAARGTDPLQRQYPTDLPGKFKSEIPGLRESLPAQENIYGQKLKGSGGSAVQDIIGTVNPFYPSGTINKNDKPTAELQRLYTATKGDNLTIAPPKTVTINGQNIKLDPDGINALQEASGKTIHDGIGKLLQNTDYQNMDDADKASAVSDVISAAHKAGALKVANQLQNGKTDDKGVMNAIGAYASAFKTSPETAFERIFSGQRILRTNNGAIIVQRLPLAESEAVKKQGGGDNASMKLDHTVPLQLGGSNDQSNLKLVPTGTWAGYTPVEDYLGRALKSNTINAKQATKLITDFKGGKMTAAQVFKQVGVKPPSNAGIATNSISDKAGDVTVTAKKADKSTKAAQSSASDLADTVVVSTKNNSDGTSSTSTTTKAASSSIKDRQTAYQTNLQNYQKDVKSGKISPVEQSIKAPQLARQAVTSNYDSDVVALYGRSASAIKSYLTDNPNPTLSAQVRQLDSDLVKTGVIAKSKFKGTSGSPTGAKTTKAKKAKKVSFKIPKATSSSSALNKLLRSSVIKAPKVSGLRKK